MSFLGYLLAWGFFAILVGILAPRFGRSSFGWFMLALIISPLFAGLLLICLPSKAGPPVVRVVTESAVNAEAIASSASTGATAVKKCPDCAETVQADARICRFCRHEFQANPSAG